MGDEKVSVIFLGEMKAGKLFSFSRVCIYLERDSSVELGILLFVQSTQYLNNCLTEAFSSCPF